MFEPYMTPTRRAVSATTARSCVISMIDSPLLAWSSPSNSSICPWIVTSSAVVGSSAIRSLGSHASVLVAMLSKGKVKLKDGKQAEQAARLAKVHKDLKLSSQEMVRIITWVDNNAQYYGTYYGRKNLKHKGHPNFRPVPTFESAIGIRPIKDEKDR